MALGRVVTAAVEKLMSHIIKRILLMETARALRKVFFTFYFLLLLLSSLSSERASEEIKSGGVGGW
jgi:hypothetical protein